MNRLFACVCSAAMMFVTASATSAVLLDISPSGVSAGVGLSPRNEFLAGGSGLGGDGSGGEVGAGISFDPGTRELHLEIAYGSAGGFTDLTGPAFAWYLHGPSSVDAVGPVLVGLGSLHRFAADPAHGGFIEGAVSLTQVQADALLAGLTYLNIYTPDFPGGELRGQLVVVPEPARAAWALLGLAACFTSAKRWLPRSC